MVGYFLVFEIEQFQIKSEIRSKIKSGVDTEYLTIITIDKKNSGSIEWIEEKEEMRYKDELFDVVKFTENEKTISYYCINKHVGANSTSKNSKKITESFVKIYFPCKQPLIVASTSELPDQIFYHNIILTSTVIQKNILPPEFA